MERGSLDCIHVPILPLEHDDGVEERDVMKGEVRLEREKREEEEGKRLVDGDWSPLAFPGRFCRRSRDEPSTNLSFLRETELDIVVRN